MFFDEYARGPSVCIAHPSVVKRIATEIKRAHALSAHDVRLASMLGLAPLGSQPMVGFNDGVVYPPGAEPANRHDAGLSPVRRLSLAGAAPTVRKLHALALLVDFSDNRGARPASEFQKLLFDPANPKSLTSYYKTLSGGQLDVSGEAIGYIRAPKPYTHYTNGQSGTGSTYPKNTPGLLVDALTKFCQTDNLRRFDSDGDGFVDGIFLIHAGGGAEAEPDPAKRQNMIWSHKWVLPQPFRNQGVSVYAYSTEPEDGRVGVFCHEFGHVLGLPDLYDTSYRSEGVGIWCLMGAGSWGGSGNQPTRMSAWCLSKLGWIKPKNVTAAQLLTLPPLASDNAACYRVWKRGASGPEYFLLEHRAKAGQDAALPAGGLAIWHIDQRQSGNTNPLSYMVGLVQADGKRQLETNVNQGDAGDLFPGSSRVTLVSDATHPSTRANDGTATSVRFSSIRLVAGTMKVRVKV
jgi:immune inhibitor A